MKTAFLYCKIYGDYNIASFSLRMCQPKRNKTSVYKCELRYDPSKEKDVKDNLKLLKLRFSKRQGPLFRDIVELNRLGEIVMTQV